MIKFFWEYFVDVEGILEEYSFTWHRTYHDVEEYSTMCTWMNNING